MAVSGLALLAAGPGRESASPTPPTPPAAARTAERADASPDLTPAATSPTPTVLPSEATSPFRLLLDEHFADNRMAWPDNRESTAWLEAGGYRLYARERERFVSVGAPVSVPLGDVVMSARFRKVGGPPGGGYGLVVRDQRPDPGDGLSQDGQYYVLEVGDQGQVGIWRRETDHWVDLLPWTASEAVHTGDQANDVEVWALGDRLSLIVNGVQVASQVDTTLRTGRVGVFVGGDSNDVLLEQLQIRTPEDPSLASTRGASESASQPAATQPAPAPVQPTPQQALPITRVVIPHTSLDAEAVPARLVDRHGAQTWEVPAFKIGHAEGSAGAGNPGNAVLVGHVTSQSLGNVFHDLHLLGVGDAVEVFSGERRFVYRVADVRTVGRTDVSVVSPTSTPTLTLMTCTGVWLPVVEDYAQRLVVRAELDPGES